MITFVNSVLSPPLLFLWQYDKIQLYYLVIKFMEKKVRKLYRSESDKIVAGVCGGLGEYFNIDPIILRLAFVLVTLAGGASIFAYIILWIIIPTESSVKKTGEDVIKENAAELKVKAESFAKEVEKTVDSGGAEKIIGLVMVIVGIMFLFGMFGGWVWDFIWKLWPVAIVIPGLLILFKKGE